MSPVELGAEPDGMLRPPAHAGVIVPPPLLFAGFLAAALLFDHFVAPVPTGIDLPTRWFIAGVLGIGGAALIALALGRFRAAGTRPEPWLPSTAIVATGIYRRSRNPMYLGMALLYLAVAVAADSWTALLAFVLLIEIVQSGVILREERYLEAIFGDAYLAYKANVRRWF